MKYNYFSYESMVWKLCVGIKHSIHNHVEFLIITQQKRTQRAR